MVEDGRQKRWRGKEEDKREVLSDGENPMVKNTF